MSDLLQSVKSAIQRENATKARRFASPEAAFKWLAMPGMDLQEIAAPKPIVNRCWCGKPISKGRNCCRECHESELKRVAQCLTTQEALDLFLQSFGGEDRAGLLAELQPYLKVTDFVEEVTWTCDCGEVGSIHVRQEGQPDNAVIGMALEFHHNTCPECPVAGAEATGCTATMRKSSTGRMVAIHGIVKDEPVEVYPDVDWVI